MIQRTFHLIVATLLLATASATAQTDNSELREVAQDVQPDASNASEDQRDPRAILERSRDAIKGLDTLTYGFSFGGKGVLQQMPILMGRATLQRNIDLEHGRLRVESEIRVTPDADPSVLVVASDGELVTARADRSQTYFTGRIDEGGYDLVTSMGENGLMEVLLEAEPFQSALEEGAELTWEGADTLDGIETDVVTVAGGGETPTRRWFIAREDHLPRRVEEIFEMPNATGSVILEIRQLRTGVNVDKSAWTVTAPEAYQRQNYASRLAAGVEAPDWTLPTGSGGELTLSDLRGRVVVLFFWSPQFSSSKAMLSELQGIHENHKDDPVTIVGIAVREQEQDTPDFFADSGATFELVRSGDEVMTQYNVRSLPGLCVIDADGRVVDGMAFLGFESLAERVESAIARGLDAMGHESAAPSEAGSSQESGDDGP